VSGTGSWEPGQVASRLDPGALGKLLALRDEVPGESAVEADREKGRAMLHGAARAALGMSGDEFLARWDAGDFPDPGDPAVTRVAMLIPFARP
jgi:hypothetical protein